MNLCVCVCEGKKVSPPYFWCNAGANRPRPQASSHNPIRSEIHKVDNSRAVQHPSRSSNTATGLSEHQAIPRNASIQSQHPNESSNTSSGSSERRHGSKSGSHRANSSKDSMQSQHPNQSVPSTVLIRQPKRPCVPPETGHEPKSTHISEKPITSNKTEQPEGPSKPKRMKLADKSENMNISEVPLPPSEDELVIDDDYGYDLDKLDYEAEMPLKTKASQEPKKVLHSNQPSEVQDADVEMPLQTKVSHEPKKVLHSNQPAQTPPELLPEDNEVDAFFNNAMRVDREKSKSKVKNSHRSH